MYIFYAEINTAYVQVRMNNSFGGDATAIFCIHIVICHVLTSCTFLKPHNKNPIQNAVI